MNIEQLNQNYAIEPHIKFIEHKSGFPLIEIDNTTAKAVISVYGGQVLSFQPKSHSDDLLFVSNKAYYQQGKAIKGGVPICWPWFGPDPDSKGRPSHGFVRNRLSKVAQTQALSEETTKIILSLSDTPDTREIWAHPFELSLSLTIGSSLTLELVTRNLCEQAVSITQGFHTYFKVGDINQVQVLGLDNTNYFDKVDGGQQKLQTGSVTIDSEVDRIYTSVGEKLTIEDPSLGRRLCITSTGSKSAVVWNPWEKISLQMGDLEDDDYKRFLCVETVNAATDVINIPSGGEYKLMANYTVES
ncbi:Aldose 1-epimerase [Gloeothece citriformis PCC 7424]|uniref:Putative glucose-6-phosphate 1-epimerase n=1 Tax=Gloeothece citriformis (strain PCC 7424) TaxID=65393 RepID=B7KG95_GLOC7|nr:D-hexose-6-phosphate mutarotase [Gloeothece citriformis]ACK70566.1 Aldose 1-epimerase [Gloeothece citriformis PCC 7424]